MERREALRSLAGAGVLAASGCLGIVGLGSEPPAAGDVFEADRYEGRDLVVELADDVPVQESTLYDSATGTEHETVDRPGKRVRFPVVFPDRLESYVDRGLSVKAKVSGGWVRRWVWRPVHGSVESLEVLADGRAKLDIESQAEAPLLVRYVGFTGAVATPTADAREGSFDATQLDAGPGVVGVDEDRPPSPRRSDLVVPGGETKTFETLYAPFAPDAARGERTSGGGDRTVWVSLVHGSGGVTSYSFPR
ncbi:hypothetical protein [Haloarchaeobius iranensis]|uniref:Uncharacterized protein n=1 Tax=Haloarchaeobius iranensis TaxID=996166 RepID=A0A1G9SBL6_9EURY|nr:hypothetical protein [Haloarchaeobius iranensis]SDM32886.1 hypothetical protein SAMN05192554_10176 [Haloarchaeobius iranensis]